MISKARIRQIHGLEHKKNRLEEGLFVAEGPKLVGELMATMRPTYVAATQQWAEAHPMAIRSVTIDVIGTDELRRASLLQHPQEVIALFPIPHWEADMAETASRELCLALDGVQDPGNLGTIVRIADWFGLRHIFCSPDTADIFNPKATQATMGALARVQLHYADLPSALASVTAPVCGTFLDGKSLYDQPLPRHGIIVMGNEGRGITKAVAEHVSHRLLIPSYPAEAPTVESLNVAVATAIVCAEFRRR